MTSPPKAKKRPYSLTLHGDTRIDNYYWLRDDKRKSSDVLNYLKQENNYAKNILAQYKVLQDQLLEEMIGRIAAEDKSVPYVQYGYRYQTLYNKGNEYPIYTRQPVKSTLEDSWEILIDGNHRSTQSKFYHMGALEITSDNKIMAIAEDFLSRRLYELRFKDLTNNSWFPEVIEYASSSCKWSNKSYILYFVKNDKKTLLPYQVWRHVLGTPTTQDVLIYEERDHSFCINLHKTTSERYILIVLSKTTSTEILLIDNDNLQSTPKPFLVRRHNHEYSLDHYQNQFYVLSNRDHKNFSLYRSKNNDEKNWKQVISGKKTVVLESVTLFREWIVLEEHHLGLIHLHYINLSSGEEKYVPFKDPTYVAWLDYNPDPESIYVRYGYSSMTTPTTLLEMNLNTGIHKVLKQTQINNFKQTDYHSERLWITARDGIKIPVSLVYRKNLFKSGTNPLIVYGYGSYGVSLEASFSASRISLLDRGFIYAIIHTRGGGELGKEWYEDGKLLKKINSFNDFIDATQGLLQHGYGDSTQTFGVGGSAGGLLIGAVINLEPNLFKGVIAQVPFVDVLTTMLDESIPLTTSEYEEWGNPNNKAFYRYILQYSPYDKVSAQQYPNLLVTTGLYDSQVQYWEPAKWVAKLRELKTNNNLLLLCSDLNSGHSGKIGRFQRYEKISMEYTFILSLTKPINI
ncbi:protease II [secondary endosymbiont of Heteropsylla cubana]|uniref:Protease II n=1 Tax=secondary endosymbiont of Heteropsylla cubana TaxID=134287 RepID=J3YST5_9ENTR|nr:prolyl oligopeptidase family serine peptidase [secondary endosymbiont of Heteropsylla cubana]AFP85363.1 protease II [secondary endosymbiont of Heteropsylla cubana]